MHRRSYLTFILREVSSVFIAWFVVFTLFQVRAVREGAGAYQEFLAWARHPAVLTANVIALFFVVFHAVTWFNLAPKALVLHLRGRRLPGHWVAASNYLAWGVVSALLAWLILQG
jgi:fumarate reductase subunit C